MHLFAKEDKKRNCDSIEIPCITVSTFNELKESTKLTSALLKPSEKARFPDNTKMDRLVNEEGEEKRESIVRLYRRGKSPRRRSLELTRSGESNWYRQATIRRQQLSRFQIESGATFAKSPCEPRSAGREGSERR